MPTGYTAAIADGISFEQFVWRCARGMGALVMMRDHPTDAPIPERFEPSNYHADRVIEAVAAFERLSAMSVEDAAASAADAHLSEIAGCKRRALTRSELRTKYEAMLADVIAWTAPTAEHAGFKIFMVDQLKQSIDWDCSDKYDEQPRELTGAEWKIAAVAKAVRDIEYHTKENNEEIKRTEGRNEWLRALRESLSAVTA